MKIIDISLALSDDLVTWPHDPRVRITRTKHLGKGSPVNLGKLSLGLHSGTHVDAPLHFLQNGSGADSFNPRDLVLPCFIKEVNGAEITLKDVREVPLSRYKAVLFKTRNTRERLLFRKKFFPDFVAMNLDAARELVNNRIKLAGIDYLSIERYKGDGSVHRLLLQARIIILEGLDLTNASQGEYVLLCLPLKVKKGDGAPSRAFLIKP